MRARAFARVRVPVRAHMGRGGGFGGGGRRDGGNDRSGEVGAKGRRGEGGQEGGPEFAHLHADSSVYLRALLYVCACTRAWIRVRGIESRRVYAQKHQRRLP